jgi:hypothetical protein
MELTKGKEYGVKNLFGPDKHGIATFIGYWRNDPHAGQPKMLVDGVTELPVSRERIFEASELMKAPTANYIRTEKED